MDAHFHEPERVITCRNTADFLAALPQLTGFTAENSVFVVLFSQSRAGHAIRFDLPDRDEPSASRELVGVICSILKDLGLPSQPDAAPAIVITSTVSFAQASGAPWRRLARQCERRLRREGIELRELCCVAPDGWLSYFDSDAPSGGHPLSDIDASPVALEARVHGEAIPDLSTLGEIPNASHAARRAVAQALEASSSGTQRRGSRASASSQRPVGAPQSSWPGPHAVPEWVTDTAEVTRAFRSDEQPLSETMTARLIRAAAQPDQWLVLALGILTRPDFPTELVLDMSARPFTGVAIDLDADPRTAAQPGWSIRRVLAAISPEFTEHRRLHGLRDRLRTIISVTPTAERPALLALSSWLWWLGGNQTVAHRHVEMALNISPDHELSRMMERVVAVPLYTGLLAQTQLTSTRDDPVISLTDPSRQ